MYCLHNLHQNQEHDSACAGMNRSCIQPSVNTQAVFPGGNPLTAGVWGPVPQKNDTWLHVCKYGVQRDLQTRGIEHEYPANRRINQDCLIGFLQDLLFAGTIALSTLLNHLINVCIELGIAAKNGMHFE